MSELRDIPVFAQCSDQPVDDDAVSPCTQKTFVDSLHAILSFDFCAGRVPAAGEVFTADGVSVEVLEAERRRIHKVRVRRLPQEEEQES